MDQPSSAQPAPTLSTPGHAVNKQPDQRQQSHPAHEKFQPMELPKVEPFMPTKPFSVAKFTLGSFNLAFAIISLGLALGIVTAADSNESHLVIVISLSLAIASILWQLAEHITLAARRKWRSIHPGAHIGVHLILLVLAILVVTSLCLNIAYGLMSYTVDGECGSSSRGGYTSGSGRYCSYETFSSQARADRYFGMVEALAAFNLLMLISHLSLFVVACVEADRRRKHGKTTKVVYLVAAPGPPGGPMYYTPLSPALPGTRGPAPAPVHHQQANADPGAHGYYAPSTGAPPGTAA